MLQFTPYPPLHTPTTTMGGGGDRGNAHILGDQVYRASTLHKTVVGEKCLKMLECPLEYMSIQELISLNAIERFNHNGSHDKAGGNN